MTVLQSMDLADSLELFLGLFFSIIVFLSLSIILRSVGLRPACRADVCARSSDTHATHNWNDFSKSKLDKRMIMVNWT